MQGGCIFWLLHVMLCDTWQVYNVIKADVDVQGCSLMTFSAFQVSQWLLACSAAAMSILSCLVLKTSPSPVACMLHVYGLLHADAMWVT